MGRVKLTPQRGISMSIAARARFHACLQVQTDFAEPAKSYATGKSENPVYSVKFVKFCNYVAIT
jgi:hypothetical protein